MVCASARFRNDGAETITPNDAKEMLPDLMKYLLFIARYLSLFRLDRRTCAASAADKSVV